jgi:hypothetical protein
MERPLGACCLATSLELRLASTWWCKANELLSEVGGLARSSGSFGVVCVVGVEMNDGEEDKNSRRWEKLAVV